MWSKYGKAIMYVIAAVAVAAQSAASGGIDRSEILAIVIVGTGAVLTYVVPLDPSRGWEKTVVGVFIAGETALVPLISGPITASGWITVGLAVFAALGVTVAPASSTRKAPAGVTGQYVGK
jgi:hypothetical protein